MRKLFLALWIITCLGLAWIVYGTEGDPALSLDGVTLSPTPGVSRHMTEGCYRNRNCTPAPGYVCSCTETEWESGGVCKYDGIIYGLGCIPHNEPCSLYCGRATGAYCNPPPGECCCYGEVAGGDPEPPIEGGPSASDAQERLLVHGRPAFYVIKNFGPIIAGDVLVGKSCGIPYVIMIYHQDKIDVVGDREFVFTVFRGSRAFEVALKTSALKQIAYKYGMLVNSAETSGVDTGDFLEIPYGTHKAKIDGDVVSLIPRISSYGVLVKDGYKALLK